MLPKTSNSLQSGLTVQYDAAAYAALIATALKNDLGGTHRAVKTICRWTGAGERSATNWLSAEHGPSGPHLAMLSHYSDSVLEAFLVMAGRESQVVEFQVSRVREALQTTIDEIDRLYRATNTD